LSLVLPTPQNILTIKNQIPNQLGNHILRVTLSFTPIGFEEISEKIFVKEFEFEVNQCIPYRSDIPAYPYNTGDPFLANHSCCSDTFSVLPNQNICFQETKYGSYQELKNYAQSTALKLSTEIKQYIQDYKITANNA